MKVKAIRKGFYGKLRDTNEEFDITKKEELGSWMKEVEVKVKAKAKTEVKNNP